MAHRRAFFALAAQLHPPVAALRTAHCRAVFSTAASASGAEWLVTAGAPIQQCALLALKLERQLLLNGYAHLHTSPIAITALSDTLAAASAACATATALRRDGAVGSAHVLELALVAAKTLMEVQELQAIAFGGYLPAPDALDECSSGGLTARTLEGAIQLACNELARRPFTPGEADTSEKLLVRLLLLVRNACTCNAYAAAAQNVHQPHGRPPLPQVSRRDRDGSRMTQRWRGLGSRPMGHAVVYMGERRRTRPLRQMTRRHLSAKPLCAPSCTLPP